MSAGFYRYEPDNLYHGPNFVLALDYQLYAENKDTYTYPVDGWYWFDSREEALNFWGIQEETDSNQEFDTI